MTHRPEQHIHRSRTNPAWGQDRNTDPCGPREPNEEGTLR